MRISKNHPFTSMIIKIIEQDYDGFGQEIFEKSELLGYLNEKTKSVNDGSKSRSSFANHYAIYVLLEDYINKGFAESCSKSNYSEYKGAKFTDLLRRKRELPFGKKLQNHALNSRLNAEFKKYYPTLDKEPIIRDVKKQRYWIQEDLILITIRDKKGKDNVFNIAKTIIKIIDQYVATKKVAFEKFITTCKEISELRENDFEKAINFVNEKLQQKVDARIFEIISYAVLKAKYGEEKIWISQIGQNKEDVEEEKIILYKTGRTNANDGGIDFVMKPLGRFFQVTETIDVVKYFLDIDKIHRFPITFVIKTDENIEKIKENIYLQAIEKYKIKSVVQLYMNAIEEIINVPQLSEYFNLLVKSGKIKQVMNEIITQAEMEFNWDKTSNS